MMGKPFNYGGQAVMEGVMMRGSRTMAVAVRHPQGQIIVHTEPLNPTLYRGPIGRLPFLRGLTMLWDSLGLGLRGLMFSANVAVEAEESAEFFGKNKRTGPYPEHKFGPAAKGRSYADPSPADGTASSLEPGTPLNFAESPTHNSYSSSASGGTLPKWSAKKPHALAGPSKAQEAFEGPLMWGTLAVGLVLGVGLFFLLPKVVAAFFEQLTHSVLVGLLAEGVVRLVLFVGYIGLIGYMPDIRRVFAYHGAEHKTINAYEAGAALTVESVRPYSTAHARCGTAFLLTLVLLSILVFAPLAHLPLGWGLATRVLLIPVLAMLAYEFIRFSARHTGQAWMRALVAPNLALQRLTTREPDDAMVQVAITALNHVLDSEREG